MKVLNKTKTEKTVKFLTIKAGECFLYKGKEYMRQIAVGGGYGVNNVVQLDNGKTFYFYAEPVTPIDGVFTYEVQS